MSLSPVGPYACGCLFPLRVGEKSQDTPGPGLGPGVARHGAARAAPPASASCDVSQQAARREAGGRGGRGRDAHRQRRHWSAQARTPSNSVLPIYVFGFYSKLPFCAYCKSVCSIYSTQPRACSDELQADEVLQSRSSRFVACARSSVGLLPVAASRARATPIKTSHCELILRISHHAQCAPGGGGETHNSETVETR